MRWSSGVKGAVRRWVSRRTARKASTKFWARLPESENNDGPGAASAAADAGFVTGVSGREQNVAVADGVPENSLSSIRGPAGDKSLSGLCSWLPPGQVDSSWT